MHCHIDLYPEPAEIICEARAKGIYVLSVTTTPRAWTVTKRLAEGASRIRTALGLHPQLVPERSAEVALFESLIPDARFVGEIGLDGSAAHKGCLVEQAKVFETLLAMVGRAGGRIMSIHSRGAATLALASLRKFPNAGDFVLHWFTGSKRELEEAVRMGAWFSVGPAMLTTPKGLELTALIPRSRVLTETDGPFGTVRGRVLRPWDSTIAVQGLARLWGIGQDEADAIVMSNFRRLVAQSGGEVEH